MPLRTLDPRQQEADRRHANEERPMSETRAARQILGLVANNLSELDPEAIAWAYSAAYKVFREEAWAEATRQLEAEKRREPKVKRRWFR
jgi:hypothetical protein